MPARAVETEASTATGCPACGMSRYCSDRHRNRCAAATPEERAHYRQFRAWPRVRSPGRYQPAADRPISLTGLQEEWLAVAIEEGERGVNSQHFNGKFRSTLEALSLVEVLNVSGQDRVFVTSKGVEHYRSIPKQPAVVPRRRGKGW